MPDAPLVGTVTIGDRTVARMGFGAMRITGRGIWGPPEDRGAAIALLRTVVDAGVQLIDTADSYGPFVSEELIAEALAPYRAGVLIATKGGLERSGPDRWHANGRPEHLQEACEGSLRRLRLETIDLYQLRREDPSVPLEDSIGALVELQRAGKIRWIGMCNVSLDQLRRARAVAKIVSVQNRYNVEDRHSEDVLRVCSADGTPFLPWHPLGGLERMPRHILAALERIGMRVGASSQQVALAWLLRKAPIVAPIPGTASAEHFARNMESSGLSLTDDEFDELDGLGA
jgi:pyridoxine 4-dehydrogenase